MRTLLCILLLSGFATSFTLAASKVRWPREVVEWEKLKEAEETAKKEGKGLAFVFVPVEWPRGFGGQCRALHLGHQRYHWSPRVVLSDREGEHAGRACCLPRQGRRGSQGPGRGHERGGQHLSPRRDPRYRDEGRAGETSGKKIFTEGKKVFRAAKKKFCELEKANEEEK